MKLGTALVREGLVTPEQLEEALKSQVIFGGKLGTNLIELGYLDEDSLMLFLSEKLDIPHAPTEALENIPSEVTDIISREMVETYKVIPVAFKDNMVDLLMLDPTDQEVIHEISSATGYVIHPMVAPEIRLFAAMEKYYGIQRDIRYISLDSTQSDSIIITPDSKPISAGHDPFVEQTNASQPSTYMDIGTDSDTSDIDFGEETMIERPAGITAPPRPPVERELPEPAQPPEESGNPATTQTADEQLQTQPDPPPQPIAEPAAEEKADRLPAAETENVGETTANLLREEDDKLDRLSNVERQLEELTATLPLMEILNEIKALRSEISDIRNQIDERKTTRTEEPTASQPAGETANAPAEEPPVTDTETTEGREQEIAATEEESPTPEDELKTPEASVSEPTTSEEQPAIEDEAPAEAEPERAPYIAENETPQPAAAESSTEVSEDEASESDEGQDSDTQLQPPPPVVQAPAESERLDEDISAGIRFIEEAIEEEEEDSARDAIVQDRRTSPHASEIDEPADEESPEPQDETETDLFDTSTAETSVAGEATDEKQETGDESTTPPPVVDHPLESAEATEGPNFSPPTETEIDDSIYDDDKPEPDLSTEVESEVLNYFDDDTGRDEEEVDIDSIYEVQRVLEQVKERDDIAAVVLSFATHMTKRAAMFVLKRHMIQGWDGRGENLYREMVSRIKIPASVPSIFKTIIDSGQPYLGPMPDQPVNDKFLSVMGGIFPEDIFILPIYVRDKLICFFYADNGDGRTIDADAVEDLQLLDQRIASAFEMLIRKTRKDLIG